MQEFVDLYFIFILLPFVLEETHMSWFNAVCAVDGCPFSERFEADDQKAAEGIAATEHKTLNAACEEAFPVKIRVYEEEPVID